MKNIKVLLTILFIFVLTVGVSANSGPSVFSGDQNSVLIPKDDTRVSVLHETLLYEVYGTNYNDKYADVTVEYELFNNGDEDETFIAVFPRIVTARSEDFTVLLNGEVIETDLKIINQEDVTFLDVLDRINELSEMEVSEVCDVYYFDSGCIGANLFEITVPANETSVLHIEYVEYPTEVKTSPYGAKIFFDGTFRYFLEPAKYWESFGSLDIIVSIPKELSLKGVSSYDKRIIDDRKEFTFQYDELPFDEFEFTVYKVSYRDYILVAIAIAFVSFMIYYIYQKRVHKTNNFIVISSFILFWTLRIAGLFPFMFIFDFEVMSYILYFLAILLLAAGLYFKRENYFVIVVDILAKLVGVLVITIMLILFV